MRYPNGLTTPPRVTSPYGWRRDPITGLRRFHNGTDSVGHPEGLNYAPEAGEVVFAGWNGSVGYEVRIRAGGRLWRLFHHAPRSLRVKLGDSVSEGQSLGATGSTGLVTGVHCHLALSVDGVQVDPFAYIAAHLNDLADAGSTPITTRKKNPMLLYQIIDKDGTNWLVVFNGKARILAGGVDDHEWAQIKALHGNPVACESRSQFNTIAKFYGATRA